MKEYIYEYGSDILFDHIDDIESGKIRVLLFFLGTKHDESFLREVVDLRKDLSKLTGDHCLAVLFMPPSLERPRPEDEEVYYTKNFLPIENWSSFVDEMTSKTDELADVLNIRKDDLPSLAFVEPQNPERVAILRMRDSNSSCKGFVSWRSFSSSWVRKASRAF